MPRGCGDWQGTAGLGGPAFPRNSLMSTPTANDATSRALFLSPEVTKMTGKLHGVTALNRGSRVPRAGSHSGGAGRYDLDKPLLCPGFLSGP